MDEQEADRGETAGRERDIAVLCVGQIVADVVVRPVRALPRAGTAVLVEDLVLTAGGCAANTACVLAKLGVKTALAGAVGADDLGGAALSRIASFGVDVGGVVRTAEAPTSSVIVLVGPDGERSFLYRSGANEWLPRDAIPGGLIARSRHVHVGGAMKLLRLEVAGLLEAAKAGGCATSLDTDWDPRGLWMGSLKGALPHVDYLLTNEEEGQMLTGLEEPVEIARKLLAEGPRAVVVKRGAMGSLLVTGDTAQDLAAFEVQALDTTCAGDAFVAGFLAGIADGWALEDAVRFGNAAGALATTQVSHLGVVSREDTLRFMSRSRPGGSP